MSAIEQLTNIRKRLSFAKEDIVLFYISVRMSLVVYLLVRDLLLIQSLHSTIIFFILCMSGVFMVPWGIGYLLDKVGLIQAFEKWDTQRNPIIMRIYETGHNTENI